VAAPCTDEAGAEPMCAADARSSAAGSAVDDANGSGAPRAELGAPGGDAVRLAPRPARLSAEAAVGLAAAAAAGAVASHAPPVERTSRGATSERTRARTLARAARRAGRLVRRLVRAWQTVVVPVVMPVVRAADVGARRGVRSARRHRTGRYVLNACGAVGAVVVAHAAVTLGPLLGDAISAPFVPICGYIAADLRLAILATGAMLAMLLFACAQAGWLD